MRKYEAIIRNLSLKDKVHLLFTGEDGKGNTIENYQFPEFKLEGNPEVLTDFMVKSFRPVASTWNDEIAVSVGKAISKSYNASGVEINITTKDGTLDFISADSYLTGRIAGGLIRGIEENEGISVLTSVQAKAGTEEDYRIKDLLSTDIAVKKGKPSMVKVNEAYTIDILNEWGYKGAYYVETFKAKEAIKGYYKGAILVDGNCEEELCDAIKLFREKKVQLANGEIDRFDFDELQLKGLIFNEDKLDDLLDDYFSFVNRLNVSKERATNKFEISEDLFAESIILLENDGSLPIQDTKDTIFIGSLLQDKTPQDKSFIDSLTEYAIPTKGYLTGFIEGVDPLNTMTKALQELETASAGVVFMESNDGLLSDTYLSVLRSMQKAGKPIVLVVFSDTPLRVDLEPYANAVLQVPAYTTPYLKSLLDILTGEVNPSARVSSIATVDSIYTRRELDEKLLAPVYPFGYGLSYSEFAYTRPEFYNNMVKLAVENKGIYDGYDVVEIFTKVPYEATKRLAGYKKVFLRSGEKKIIEIALDDKAFRYYNEDKRSYGIKAGSYDISICRNVEDVIFTEKVELDNYLDKKEGSTSKVESGDFEPTMKKFLDTPYKKKHREEKLGMAFGKKLAIAVIADLYYTIMLGALLAINVLNHGNEAITIALIVLAIVSNVIFFICVAIFNEKRRKNEAIKESLDKEDYAEFESMTSMIDTIPEFKNIAYVCYKEPVDDDSVSEEEIGEPEVVEEVVEVPEQVVEAEEAEIVEEAPIPEGILEETKEEEEKQEEEEDIDLDDDSDSEFTQPYKVPPLKGLEKKSGKFVAIDDLCIQFNTLLVDSGYILELAQIRALLAGVLSAKMMFVNSANKEALIGVLELLDEFFGNELNPIHTENDWESTLDLIWTPTEDEGVYTYSDFTVELLDASQNPKGLKLVVLDNINVDTFARYFHKFIRASQAPKVDYFMSLDKKYKIPSNVCYILIPNDNLFIEHMNPKIMEASLFLDLNIGVSTIKEVPVTPYSYTELQNQIAKRAADMYMDEDQWKKLDDLEDEIRNVDMNYIHTNRSALMMEKFVNVLLMLDPERYVLDDALSMYYVPLLKTLALYKKANGDEDIKDIMVRIFGADNIPLALAKLVKPLIEKKKEVAVEKVEEKTEELSFEVKEEAKEEENIVASASEATEEVVLEETPVEEPVEETILKEPDAEETEVANEEANEADTNDSSDNEEVTE